MELFRALGVLAERPDATHTKIGAIIGLTGIPDPSTYTDLFSLQLYPYASVYLGSEGMLGGEARDRVAGFWRALNLVPPAEADHLATLLSLYAELRERTEEEAEPARRSALDRARRALLWEHLLPWVPLYAHKMQAIADDFYASWARLLEASLYAEIESDTPVRSLPLHLREALPLADPRSEGARSFIAGLLAPVRSGLIVVRADLARAACALGLGLRQGERRFVLESLFAQDRAGTLAWLEAEARATSMQLGNAERLPGAIRYFWKGRSAETARLLAALRETMSDFTAASSPSDAAL